MLVSAVQWGESAPFVHIPPTPLAELPTTPSPPSGSPQSTKLGLPVLSSIFPLAVCFTHDSALMSNLISQFIPPSPSLLCLHICSLHLHFYSIFQVLCISCQNKGLYWLLHNNMVILAVTSLSECQILTCNRSKVRCGEGCLGGGGVQNCFWAGRFWLKVDWLN